MPVSILLVLDCCFGLVKETPSAWFY